MPCEHRSFPAWLVLPVATLAFAFAYTKFPGFHGNANTYLLHGLACAGDGALRKDWLAGTVDPFPLFGGLTCVLGRLAPPSIFHLAHGVLLGAYLIWLCRIVSAVHGFAVLSAKGVTFMGLAILLHSALFRAFTQWATGEDWGWYLQAGLANQYVLGFAFQPSLFGVLVFASLAAFLRRRDVLAVLLAVAAAAMHSSYGLTAATLVAVYGGVHWKESRAQGARASFRQALPPWLVGFPLLGTIAVSLFVRFQPSDPETFARAQEILTDIRIEHHALPAHWVHPSMWLQLPLVLAGLFIARKSRMGLPLLALATVATLLTLAQVVTHSRTLALAFPWRVSVFLVPLSVALIVGRCVAADFIRGTQARLLVAVSALGASGAVLYGARAMRQAFREYEQAPALGMMAWVRERSSEAELFVIPTSMQRFRLETGARTFVDWKSHPYRDAEVVEWYARIQAARALEGAQGESICRQAAGLVERYAVTHFVFSTDTRVSCLNLREEYRDGRYAVFAFASE
ncbi:DUF6798 domain-containing protein [Corallococcus sp. 4LFB]|uniref:DUF6798 domain-containing protein n=1 Tax=Corallococcus sp. 4LFB TaxID=3383249 RepID=UPI003975602D